MESEQTPATAFLAMPVFPLFKAVLFPGVLIPLSVVDPAFCAMVEESLSTHGLLTLVMVVPGAESLAHPPLCEVGCLARIAQAERLAGGGFNILVHGLGRVHLLEELVPSRDFRRYRVQPVPAFEKDACARASPSFQRLESCIVSLNVLAQSEDRELAEVLRSRTDPLELGDVLSAILIPDCERQQSILASRSLERRLGIVIDGMMDTMVKLRSRGREPDLFLN